LWGMTNQQSTPPSPQSLSEDSAPSPPAPSPSLQEEMNEEDLPQRAPINYDNVKTFYDLSDEQIANIDFKELTRLMAEAGLTDDEVSEAKARRRRLKNRHSARVCSNKKREKCTELTETNRVLQKKIAGLQSENGALRSENSALKQQAHGLTKAYTEHASEVARLRQQVSALSQMLVNAGMLACVDDAAALAA